MSGSYTGLLNGAFFPPVYGFPHAFTCYVSCVHECQLFAAQDEEKKIEKLSSIF